jgi:hypothetical protein
MLVEISPWDTDMNDSAIVPTAARIIFSDCFSFLAHVPPDNQLDAGRGGCGLLHVQASRRSDFIRRGGYGQPGSGAVTPGSPAIRSGPASAREKSDDVRGCVDGLRGWRRLDTDGLTEPEVLRSDVPGTWDHGLNWISSRVSWPSPLTLAVNGTA